MHERYYIYRGYRVKPLCLTQLRLAGSSQWNLKSDTMAIDVCDQVSNGKSLRSIVKRFAERTSMQGVSFLSTSRSWYARIIWSCLLLTSLAMLFYHLTYLMQIYYSWPKQTSVSLGFSPLPFPTITICNTNPVKQSKLGHVSNELYSFLYKANPSTLVKEQRKRRVCIIIDFLGI